MQDVISTPPKPRMPLTGTIEHRALSEAVKALPEAANALNLLACLEYHMESHE